MPRKVLKKISTHEKLEKLLDKYNIPREFLATSRKMVTRGILYGLFWALIPMPSQMAAVAVMTFFVRFNVPIALAMVWLSNPITMPPMFYVEYITGNYLLGWEGINEVQFTFEWLWEHIGDIGIPLYVGTVFYCLTIPPFFYFTINWLWIRSVHRDKRKKDQERKGIDLNKS